MIFGIGCDIVNIDRIQSTLDKFRDKFLNRVFTEQEIRLSRSANSVFYYAKRFSAKEAYAKAAGCGIGKKINFQDIEILNDENGAPYFSKHPLQKKNIRAFLSISDEIKYAISYVVLEKN